MKRLPLHLLGLACLTGCGTPSAPDSRESSSAAPSFERIRFNFTQPAAGVLSLNECPPLEVVEITGGKFHFQGYEERAADGTLLGVTVHFNAMGVVGIGRTTGLKYRILDNDKGTLVFGPGEEVVGQEEDVRFRLIRQGSAENMWVRSTFVFTAPDNFEVKRSEFECRG